MSRPEWWAGVAWVAALAIAHNAAGWTGFACALLGGLAVVPLAVLVTGGDR